MPCFQNKICSICSSQEKFATIFCSSTHGNSGQEPSNANLPKHLLFITQAKTLAQPLKKTKSFILKGKHLLSHTITCLEYKRTVYWEKRNKWHFSFLKASCKKDEKCKLKCHSFQICIFFPHKYQHKLMHILKFAFVADRSMTSRTSKTPLYQDKDGPDAVPCLEGQEVCV